MLPNKLLSIAKSGKTQKFAIYGLGQAVNLVSPLLVIPYIVYIVGEKGLGRVGVGMSLAYILIVLVDYSSYIKSVREIALNRDNNEKLREIIATVYYAKTLLVIGITALVTALCFILPYFRNDKSLFFLSMFIIYGQYVNPTWFLQGIEDFKTISAINVISKIIYVAGVFALVTMPSDYVYVNFWLGFGVLLPAAVVVFGMFRKYHVGLKDFNFGQAMALIRQDFSFCLSQLMFSFRQYSPIMVVSLFAGDVVAGQYKIIEQIIMLFRTYFQTVFKFSYSIVSYEINHTFEKGLATWKKINGYNLALGIFLLTVIFLNADFVFRFFKVTKEFLPLYHSLLEASIAIPVVIGITLAQEQLMFSLDKNREYIKITIFITLFSTASIIAFLSIWEIKGVFLALLLTEIVLMLIYHWILKSFYLRKPQAN
jgi:O-antigen/teichoic acid export membrane protein